MACLLLNRTGRIRSGRSRRSIHALRQRAAGERTHRRPLTRLTDHGIARPVRELRVLRRTG
ncbi:hypothetical protein [Nocardia sp. NPDC056564]